MESLKNENGCKAFLLMVTNVLDGDTKLLVVCDDDVKELIEKALGKIENNEIFHTTNTNNRKLNGIIITKIWD